MLCGSHHIKPLQILSKDSVAVHVDAVVYYSIFDPKISVTNIKDASSATRLLAQTTLRNVLGAHTLSVMLSERETQYLIRCRYYTQVTDSRGCGPFMAGILGLGKPSMAR